MVGATGVPVGGAFVGGGRLKGLTAAVFVYVLRFPVPACSVVAVPASGAGGGGGNDVDEVCRILPPATLTGSFGFTGKASLRPAGMFWHLVTAISMFWVSIKNFFNGPSSLMSS